MSNVRFTPTKAEEVKAEVPKKEEKPKKRKK